MLKFKRDKLVNIVEKKDTLVAHGVLDDDIYSLELNVVFGMSDLNLSTTNLSSVTNLPISCIVTPFSHIALRITVSLSGVNPNTELAE